MGVNPNFGGFTINKFLINGQEKNRD